jgi:hypothetical protein
MYQCGSAPEHRRFRYSLAYVRFTNPLGHDCTDSSRIDVIAAFAENNGLPSPNRIGTW